MPVDPVPAPVVPPITPPEPVPAPVVAGVVPAAVPAPPVAPTYPELSTITPPEFKDKGWVAEVKDIPGLFKKVDFLQSKIGERPAGIPQETAPQAEWDKFYLSFGRPEKADGYEFDKVPEGLTVDEGFQTNIKGVMHQAGVNKKQAKILETGYNKLLVGQAEAQKAAQGKADTDFEEMGTKVFGEQKDRALQIAKSLIAKHTPEVAKPFIANLSNEALIVLASTLNGVAATYIKEDQLPVGGAPVGPQSQDQKQEEGRKLMASEAYTNPFHTEHDATVKRVNELYGN